jgi:hypothetical protein
MYFRRTSGVTSTWICENFNNLPDDPTEYEKDKYARVWLWHFLGSFLFPDGSGNIISWMFLEILSQPWENIEGYSWGRAVLSWLYIKMATGTYPMGSAHPYPYPHPQNFTRRVTRTRMRVKE